MTPNLFQFATSELSQDAVLCWLLSWADAAHEERNIHLHLIGQALLSHIYERTGTALPQRFSPIEILKQDGHVDILCIVNNETVVLVEDKAGTKQHSNQLARYIDHVQNNPKYAGCKVIPVFIQTGDQSDYKEVEANGYTIITRRDLLDILESELGVRARAASDIVNDFSRHLRHIEDDVQSYKLVPPLEWTSNAWRGFFTVLKNRLGDGNWDYVANPAGGFIGFWWHFRKRTDSELYLQLEEDRLCFKIYVDHPEKRSHLRQQWHDCIVASCSSNGLPVSRPRRFGNGQFMTIASLDGDYRMVDSNGILDMPATLRILDTAQAVIDDCP